MPKRTLRVRRQPGEEVVYLLVFEGELLDGATPESQAQYSLTARLSEALPIPILDEWAEALWEAGVKKQLISDLVISGDCLAGYGVNAPETGWAEILTRLVKDGNVKIR